MSRLTWLYPHDRWKAWRQLLLVPDQDAVINQTGVGVMSVALVDAMRRYQYGYGSTDGSVPPDLMPPVQRPPVFHPDCANDGVIPNIGPETGGQTITCNGPYMRGVHTILINGVPCTNVVVNSQIQCQGVTPAGVGGPWDVEVINPWGSDICPLTYIYEPFELYSYLPDPVRIPSMTLLSYLPDPVRIPAMLLYSYLPDPVKIPSWQLIDYRPDPVRIPTFNLLSYVPDPVRIAAFELLSYVPDPVRIPTFSLIDYTPDPVRIKIFNLQSYLPDPVRIPFMRLDSFLPDPVRIPFMRLDSFLPDPVKIPWMFLRDHRPDPLLIGPFRLDSYLPDPLRINVMRLTDANPDPVRLGFMRLTDYTPDPVKIPFMALTDATPDPVRINVMRLDSHTPDPVRIPSRTLISSNSPVMMWNPALVDIEPDVEAWDATFTLFCYGYGFDPTCEILLDGVAQVTTFVSPTELTCQVAALNDPLGHTYDVQVRKP
jgi:hypothetical protein